MIRTGTGLELKEGCVPNAFISLQACSHALASREEM